MGFYLKLFLALALAGSSDAFFRMSCPGRVVRDRIDPIVAPGKIAGHVHTISGGSGFKAEMTYADARASKCSSCEIKVSYDLSCSKYMLTLRRKTCPTTGRPLSTCT
jgi:hypothetical protein